jgi:Antibiotic biosynthesis monooxygenase
MVVEYIRYTVPVEQAEAFESAYARAGNLLEQDEHCLGFEVARGIEEPDHFIVRIEWDSGGGNTPLDAADSIDTGRELLTNWLQEHGATKAPKASE